MKKIILVLVGVFMMGCCLDDQEREADYIESHSWYVSVSNNYIATEYVYVAISPEGVEYIDVTIDNEGNVYDSEGLLLFCY